MGDEKKRKRKQRETIMGEAEVPQNSVSPAQTGEVHYYPHVENLKILNDLTNNDIGITFSNGKNCTRSGSTACIVPPVPRGVPAGVATLYEHSFAVKAPQLWNCLPSKAVDKDASSLSAFKSSLGPFLDKVPDVPPTGQSGVNNNSLLDWAKQNFQN